MESYFFNAEPTADLVNHPTGYDREYDADDHAAFFAPFFSQAGVMAGPEGDACKVVVQEGALLRVCAGCAYVRGRMVQFDGTETVMAPGGCRIVARMNKTADVRAFQLLAVEEPVHSEDIYDLELAAVTLTPVSGGYEAQVVDTRTFLAFTGQPPYYPPEGDLPYALWRYTLGFPLPEDQRAAVEANPSLMAVHRAGLGGTMGVVIGFTAGEWSGGRLVIPQSAHGRQSGRFGYTLRHRVNGALKDSTWAVKCTGVSFTEATGDLVLESDSAYDGQLAVFG